MTTGKDLHEMRARAVVLIQFACGTNQIVDDALDTSHNCSFTKYFLKNITRENADITEIFRSIANYVYQESNQQQKPLSANELQRHQQVYFNGLIVPTKDDADNLSTKTFLSKQPLSSEEESYYQECKKYYHLTQESLISIAPEVFHSNIELASTFIKVGIGKDCNDFDLKDFLNKFCHKLNLPMDYITVKHIQTGSSILEAEICNKFESSDKKIIFKYDLSVTNR
ncbi:unnamed protein product [Rotaria socialis]|uniref:Uncharacterized protein n=1 Tax=Rotaria socialis TaxID=392032 RepID=A0A820ZBJ8_9BILA|nr:unnamed protein product [Rotaria socialis]